MTHSPDRSGSSPAASTCTGRRPSTRSPSSPRRSSACSRPPAGCPPRSSGSRCSPSAAAIRRVMLEANTDPECIGVIAWMHTFSPAKMWITGLDALRKPLLHLHTQLNAALPWASIDMDFMNLNQAAHGDREFGYIQTRLGVARKTVAGHARDPAVWCGAVDGWIRAAARPRPARRPAAGPLRRQHARRRGDRGRQGRGRAALRRLGEHLRGQRPGRRGRRRATTPTSTRWWPSTPTPTGSRRSSRGAASGTTSLRYAARIEAGLREFLARRRGSAPSPPTSRTSAACASCPGLAVQRLMADGYGFGGEGDWKTAALLAAVKAMGADGTARHLVHGGLHLPLRAGRAEDPRRAHARGLPEHRRGHAHRARSTPWASATGRTRCGSSSTPRRARPPCIGIVDLGDRFRLVANDDRGRPAGRAAAEAAGRPRGVEARAVAVDLGRAVADRGRPAPHGAHRRRPARDAARLRGDDSHRAAPDRRRRHPSAFADRIRWNQAYYRLAHGL